VAESFTERENFTDFQSECGQIRVRSRKTVKLSHWKELRCRPYSVTESIVGANEQEASMAGTESLVLEHLRAIRATVERTERELGDVPRRVGSIEQHLANLQSDVANLRLRLDHQGERLDRIARRLDIADAPG